MIMPVGGFIEVVCAVHGTRLTIFEALACISAGHIVQFHSNMI